MSMMRQHPTSFAVTWCAVLTLSLASQASASLLPDLAFRGNTLPMTKPLHAKVALVNTSIADAVLAKLAAPQPSYVSIAGTFPCTPVGSAHLVQFDMAPTMADSSTLNWEATRLTPGHVEGFAAEIVTDISSTLEPAFDLHQVNGGVTQVLDVASLAGLRSFSFARCCSTELYFESPPRSDVGMLLDSVSTHKPNLRTRLIL